MRRSRRTTPDGTAGLPCGPWSPPCLAACRCSPIAIPPSNPNCALAAAAWGPTNLCEPDVEPALLNPKSIGNTPLSKKRVHHSVHEHGAQIEIGLRTHAAPDPDTHRTVLRCYNGQRSTGIINSAWAAREADPRRHFAASFRRRRRVPDQPRDREDHEYHHRDHHEPKQQRGAVAALGGPAVDAPEWVNHALAGSFGRAPLG